jgi:hypothetical protein
MMNDEWRLLITDCRLPIGGWRLRIAELSATDGRDDFLISGGDCK